MAEAHAANYLPERAAALMSSSPNPQLDGKASDNLIRLAPHPTVKFPSKESCSGDLLRPATAVCRHL